MKLGQSFPHKKYLLILLGISVFLGSIIGIVNITANYVKLSRESALYDLKGQLTAGAEQLQFYYNSLRSDVLRIQRYLSNRSMKVDKELYRYLKFVKDARPEAIRAILILDTHGDVIAGTDPALLQVNLGRCKYYKKVRQTPREVYLSEALNLSNACCSRLIPKVFKDTLDTGFEIHAGVHSQGVFKGSVVFILKGEPFFSRYSTAIATLTSGYGFIVQEDGRILHHREVELRGRLLTELPESSDMAKAHHLLKNEEGEIVAPRGIGKHMMVTSELYLENQRWILGISTITSTVAQKALTFIFTLSGVVVILGIIIFGLVFALIRLGRAEEDLAAEKERLGVTLRSIGDGVIATDKKGTVVLINKVAEALTGWTQEDAIGKPLDRVFHIINEKTRVPCENPHERVCRTGEIIVLANDTLLMARDKNERIIAHSGAPIRDRDGTIIGVILVFRDITEQHRMEQELQKASKLESVGILAGGIAHDFNNILTAILGNIQLAKMHVKPENKLSEILGDARDASLRAKSLTQQLLTFSKGGRPILKSASIEKLLKDTTRFALRGSNVRCEFFISETLQPVEVDEAQISQVINNLVINSQQAMPEGGTITVHAENMAKGTKYTDRGLPLGDGEYVKISIRDQGIGISREHLQKIFDPYFTTKQKGSGLGLATSYSIIKKHNGYMTVESETGAGTTFFIYLPASQKKIVTSTDNKEQSLKGEGRVLVMDDEEPIRKLANRILTGLGYEVAVASNGAEAIELYKKAKESDSSFDAVVMDLTIPGGMGGKETVQKLIEIDPEVKAIVSSGYSNDPVMADFRKYGFKGCVIKPYESTDLGKTLLRVVRG